MLITLSIKKNKEEISNNDNNNKTVRKINFVLVYWCLLQYITTKLYAYSQIFTTYDNNFCLINEIQFKFLQNYYQVCSNTSGHVAQGVGLWLFTCLDNRFESHWRHWCLSVVCCLVEVSVMGQSLMQRSPAKWGESECDPKTSKMRRPWPTRPPEPCGKTLLGT